MNYRTPLLAIIILLSGCAEQPAHDPAADVQAMRETVNTFVEAFAAGDAAAAVALFAEGAIVMPSNDVDLVGHDAMLAYWSPGFVNNTIDLSVDIQSVEASGDLGFMDMHTFAAVTPKAGGETVHLTYRDQVVFKRINGEWKIYRDLSQAAPEVLVQSLGR